jgi:hypothetical protein
MVDGWAIANWLKEHHAHIRESMESMSAFFPRLQLQLVPPFVCSSILASFYRPVQDGSSAPCVKESAGDRRNGTHGEDEAVNIKLTEKNQDSAAKLRLTPLTLICTYEFLMCMEEIDRVGGYRH